MLEKNKKVYIKNFVDFSALEPDEYVIIDINKDFAVIQHSSLKFYKKIHIDYLVEDKKNASYNEAFKKGDLVICIINNHIIENGIIINVYKNSVLVLIGSQRKRVSKNNVFIKSES